MQRLHANDLAGLMIEGGGWQHLSLPAIATSDERIALTRNRFHKRREGEPLHPERESLQTLMRQKAEMGSAIFSAQYQQDPVPPHGNMVQREWLQYYSALPADLRGRAVQSWDTASKDGVHNDWSVCVTARTRRQEIYIIDVFRRKMQFPELKRRAIQLAREHRAHALLIEDAASGTQLYQALRNEQPSGVPSPIRQSPDGDKVTRFSGVTAMIEAERIFLPKEAPWLADFEKELLGFPNAKHDDQVDALTQLLLWADKRSRRRSGRVGAPIEITENGHYCGDDFTDMDPEDI